MKGKRLIPYALFTLLSSNSPTHDQSDALLMNTPLLQSIETHHLVVSPDPQTDTLESPWTVDFDPTEYTLEDHYLLSMRSPDGSSLFCTPQELEQFQLYLGSIQEAEQYALVLTKLKNPLHRVCDKAGLSLYKEKGGALEELLILLDITEDGTDKTDSLFKTWEDVALYKASGGDATFAHELAGITNGDGSIVFRRPQDYTSAALIRKDKNITVDIIQKVHNIKGEADNELFRTAYDLLPVLAAVLGPSIMLDDFVALGDIKAADGRLLFKTAEDYSRASNTTFKKEQLIALAKLKNRKGEPLFTRGADAVLYAHLGKNDTYLETLLAIRNKTGKQIFSDGSYIAPFAMMDGKFSDAQSLADLVDADNKPLLKPYQVARYAALGYNADSLFHEAATDKPNMLLLFSQSDWNGAFQNTDVKAKLFELRKTYDVVVGFLDDDTLFEREPNALQDKQLFTVAGHGSSSAITLGDGTEEHYFLDKTDTAFCQALTYLPSDAVIFLFSCSTASGGAGADTFANYVALCAPGRKLIASTEPFASSDFKITSSYPFSVTITVKDKYPYNQNPITNTIVTMDATYERVAQQLVITKVE